MRGAVCFADDDVRMQPRLTVLWHNVPNVPGEREHLDLFFDQNLLVGLLLAVKESECHFAEGANGGQVCICKPGPSMTIRADPRGHSGGCLFLDGLKDHPCGCLGVSAVPLCCSRRRSIRGVSLAGAAGRLVIVIVKNDGRRRAGIRIPIFAP